ncbi:MAG TPA: hypothetical protein VH575_23880 [Gemmataceae bacterium]|jgi:hypothetical protein
MIQPPVAIALTVCEQVIVEEKTHNVTLVNCMTRLRVRQVPSEAHRLVVHAWLAGGRGEGKIRLEWLHPETLEEILSRELPATFPHPLQEARATFRASLSFPVEGRYQINLLADGAVIAHRTFQVFLREEM